MNDPPVRALKVLKQVAKLCPMGIERRMPLVSETFAG